MLASILKLLFNNKKRPQGGKHSSDMPENWEKACHIVEGESADDSPPSLEERILRLNEHMARVPEGSPEWNKLNGRLHILQQKLEKKTSPDGLSTEQRRRHRQSQEDRIKKKRDDKD